MYQVSKFAMKHIENIYVIKLSIFLHWYSWTPEYFLKSFFRISRKIYSNFDLNITVLCSHREQNLPPKMPKCSLWEQSAPIGNKDFLKNKKIRFYYIERLKRPICIIVIIFSSHILSQITSSNFFCNIMSTLD